MAFTPWQPLSGANLLSVPAQPGVYYLSDGYEVVYIGMAERSLRDRLQAHASGNSHIPVLPSWTFSYVVSSNPVQNEVWHLNEYKREHGGALPRHNQKVG